jgi:hypothetical protein
MVPARKYASPYLGMGNNPMNGTDPGGGEWIPDGRDYYSCFVASCRGSACLGIKDPEGSGYSYIKFNGALEISLHQQILTILYLVKLLLDMWINIIEQFMELFFMEKVMVVHDMLILKMVFISNHKL